MTGIFPSGGCSKDNAVNTVSNPDLVAGCNAKYHCPRCTPRFDPSSANAIISELLNAINCAGLDYDCDKLTNLCDAIEQHEIKIEGFIEYPNLPFDVPDTNNNTVVWASGSGLISNNFRSAINVLGVADMPLRVIEHVKGAHLRVSFVLTDNFGNTLTQLRFEINNQNDNQVDSLWNLIQTRQFDDQIPAGGKTYSWSLQYTCDTAGAFTIDFSGDGESNSGRGVRLDAIGNSATKRSHSFIS